MSTSWERWKADRAVYPPRAWLSEPGYWAVWVYRFGAWTLEPDGARVAKRLLWPAAFALHVFMKAFVSIEIPFTCDIGPGFRVFHQGTIVLGGGIRIGARCRLRQGVTIGVAVRGDAVPVLGDDVFLGVNAVVLGPVTIGDGATVAAGAVVMKDVEPGTVVGGVPAKVIRGRSMAASG
ncbi:MAG: serine acetyltransferase [Microbacterium sp.]|nr:serine acetyltransferase [Microbacterium sp.]